MIEAETNLRVGLVGARGREGRWQKSKVEGRSQISDRKFLYAVHCAAHLLLEARNRLVFANRARPTSPSDTPSPSLILTRKRCPNSPLCLRDFRFGISAFTAPPNM